jgi:hypothetical protein
MTILGAGGDVQEYKKDGIMNRMLLFVLLVAVNLMVGGCAHSTPSATAPEAVPMAVIFGGSMAGGTDMAPGGVWLSDQKQLDALMDRLFKGTRIPSQVGPDIDFSAEGVLVVWMGRKTSGGYALELAADRAEIEDHTARVPVRWIEPAKGAMVTQIMTDPYLMVRLAKGGYDKIVVIDADGAIRVEVEAKQN